MMNHIYENIQQLLLFGVKKGLIEQEDMIFTRNQILEILEIEEWKDVVEDLPEVETDTPAPFLDSILDWAAENGKLEANTVTYRDLLDTKIMGCFLPKPSVVNRTFASLYEKEGPVKATKYLYKLSQESHYIRMDRIAKNDHWFSPTEYGDIEITVNLSKPEKDPIAIANAKNASQSTYPSCLLCKENVGYAGRINHPARQNLRTIPVELGKEAWYLQFSPYVYYNEHAIVFLGEHLPMKISKRTFDILLEFVEQMPHYFLGSNADLPIVGGSILSHDHYQGGHHDFPMAKAEIETEFTFKDHPSIKAGIVKWPMSVIRLQGEDRHELSELAEKILTKWRGYSDESVGIHAMTGDVPHNTITPIARRRNSLFEIDLVLRNNRTNDEHPLGIFHPHAEVHHIKKENIGLIEVMGLAVLPGRLKDELQHLGELMLHDQFQEEIKKNEDIEKHLEWAMAIKEKYSEINESTIDEILKQEVGLVFSEILEHCGVYKRTEQGKTAFIDFLQTI
ncbi:UDP-glucose--hexose-1-phosphate uridylyltransferase [Bacillus sp. PS06]|uniref:UDP-glucose--hexose-1-phosphate uridylyltransferase n=1 Tax=Bacillus sp. PS06 TaxID=2764176 RepID=UPI001780D0F9|nr:UDP-glucose--hexose-1-phosphate uridylyltransferase [Bacillus sp. PS06]MBD8070485.1 UDP-glucose--hexose-1-phosphate uridylyltransferase [Bacillus sp. PS06]